jgi:NAD(P)-dependent dehydrogenase (short-subunit alcohol dehydrogenase family)
MLPKPTTGKLPLLITGSTDGIGLAAANMLVTLGHHVLLHGRNPGKLEKTQQSLSTLPGGGRVEGYVADLSHLPDVATLVQAVTEKHTKLDVLINNAGGFKTTETRTQDGLDGRFAVNTLAPYLLSQRLMSLIGASGRVINLSSAAQSPVDPEASSFLTTSPPTLKANWHSRCGHAVWRFRSMALAPRS